MSAGWIAAGAVSFVAHLGFAAWVDNAEPKAKPLRDVEMTVMPLEVKAPEPPKPPPPPPEPEPKQLVKKPIKQAPPTPAPTKKIGTPEETLAPASDVVAPIGVDNDGIAGTGTSMDKELPPPPPEPAPPPPVVKKVKFLPAFQVDVMPKIKHAAQPEIPAAFRDAQREAVVVIEVEIDITGKVVGARVLKHAEYGLDDAALAAAKQTTFEPARMQNQPVPVRYQIPYRFKVRG